MFPAERESRLLVLVGRSSTPPARSHRTRTSVWLNRLSTKLERKMASIYRLVRDFFCINKKHVKVVGDIKCTETEIRPRITAHFSFISSYLDHIQVVDLRPLMRMFGNTFHFAPDLHLGEMVIPHLAANFGPIYMCKLKRLT